MQKQLVFKELNKPANTTTESFVIISVCLKSRTLMEILPDKNVHRRYTLNTFVNNINQ